MFVNVKAYLRAFFIPECETPKGLALVQNPFQTFIWRSPGRIPPRLWFLRLGKPILQFIAYLCIVLGAYADFNIFFAVGLGWVIWSRICYLSAYQCIDQLNVTNIKLIGAPLHKGERGTLQVTIKNENSGAVFDVLVFFPTAMSSDAALWANASCIEGRTVSRVNVPCHANAGMGRFVLKQLFISVSDRFGLHTVTVEHVISHEVVVVPEPLALSQFPLPAGFIPNPLGYWETGQSGQSCNFLQLRPWRPGDSIRFVHWARSLRADELLVQTFETAASVQATFLLDHHPAGHCVYGDISSLETLRESLFALAGYCTTHHIDTRIMTDQWDTGMGRGAEHLQLIREIMINTRLDSQLRMGEMLARTAQELPPRSLLVLFFSTGGFKIKEALEVIYGLIQRQIDIVLIGADSMLFSESVSDRALLQGVESEWAVGEFHKILHEREKDPEVRRLKSMLAQHTYLLGPGMTIADVLCPRRTAR